MQQPIFEGFAIHLRADGGIDYDRYRALAECARRAAPGDVFAGLRRRLSRLGRGFGIGRAAVPCACLANGEDC
ncbi:MAG: hypothetical protein R3D02_12660 [Hyphomicrobiales bacterium]